MTVGMSTALYGEPVGSLYPAVMTKREQMTVQDARRHFSERLDKIDSEKLAETGGAPEHTVVARRGRTVGVIVDIEWYRRMAEADGDPTEF